MSSAYYPGFRDYLAQRQIQGTMGRQLLSQASPAAVSPAKCSWAPKRMNSAARSCQGNNYSFLRCFSGDKATLLLLCWGRRMKSASGSGNLGDLPHLHPAPNESRAGSTAAGTGQGTGLGAVAALFLFVKIYQAAN